MMKKISFRGFLYAGIMIRNGEPYVLEYNVRMGDPECQPITMRMDFDLYDYLNASVDGNLIYITFTFLENLSLQYVLYWHLKDILEDIIKK